MPYPLPDPPATDGSPRLRLLPPIGCPGLEQWVLPLELAGWTELGYRQGPVPAAALELFWLPAVGGSAGSGGTGSFSAAAAPRLQGGVTSIYPSIYGAAGGGGNSGSGHWGNRSAYGPGGGGGGSGLTTTNSGSFGGQGGQGFAIHVSGEVNALTTTGGGSSATTLALDGIRPGDGGGGGRYSSAGSLAGGHGASPGGGGGGGGASGNGVAAGAGGNGGGGIVRIWCW